MPPFSNKMDLQTQKTKTRIQRFCIVAILNKDIQGFI